MGQDIVPWKDHNTFFRAGEYLTFLDMEALFCSRTPEVESSLVIFGDFFSISPAAPYIDSYYSWYWFSIGMRNFGEVTIMDQPPSPFL